jgi:tetratricopeptide (TPR) repeat protein
LIQAFPDEKLIWAKNYKSDIANSQKLFNNVAGQIAGEIGFDLTPENIVQLPAPRKINPVTYGTYLRGMYYLNQSTDEGVLKGIEYFNEVLKIDPGDPFAYAGLSLGYATIAHGTFDKGDALDKAEAAAMQAVRLDTTIAEVYAALAVVSQYGLWKFDQAEKYFKKALALNPNLAIIHYHYSWGLHLWSRDEEAITEHKLAKKYDPFNPLHTAWLGGLYFCKGQYDEAVKVALESFEIQKDYPVGYFILGLAYREMGRIDEALNAHKKLAELYPEWLWALGYTYAVTNHREEAEKILNDIESQPVNPYNAYCRIVVNTALGKKDEAFKWVNYEPHHAWTAWVAVEPWFNELHGDPRFDEFVKKLNLPKK